ncbi:hypothetical protein MKX07_000197 [Trichoderma sp. CBMAI-0711]|nr:hypothetical protein MKX07_000197 [Trichoderma sp. CBMAI-0711]
MQAIASPTKRRAVLGSLDANAAMASPGKKVVVVARQDLPHAIKFAQRRDELPLRFLEHHDYYSNNRAHAFNNNNNSSSSNNNNNNKAQGIDKRTSQRGAYFPPPLGLR